MQNKYINNLFRTLENTCFSNNNRFKPNVIEGSDWKDQKEPEDQKDPEDKEVQKISEGQEGTIYKDYSKGIDALVELFSRHKSMGSTVYFIGNGGSSSIASHFTADFMKNGGMRTASLYDNAVTTCMANDYGYEYVFSKPLGFLLREEDLLVAISSSGKSKSIINAVDIAKTGKTCVITLTGFREDNPVRQRGSFNVYVPSDSFGIVESIHTIILQQVVDTIAKRDGISL